MRTYQIVKNISKINLVLSVIAIFLVSAIYFVSQSSVGADESQQQIGDEQTYSFNSEGENIISLTICSDQFNNERLEGSRIQSEPDSSGNRTNLEPELLRGDNQSCYTLTNSNNFRSPRFSSAIFEFFRTARQIIPKSNQSLLKIMGNYFLQLYEGNEESTFIISEPPSGTLINGQPLNGYICVLSDKNAIKQAVVPLLSREKENYIDDSGLFLDKYGYIDRDESGQISAVRFFLLESGYPEAIPDPDEKSLWWKVNDILYSYINNNWVSNGVDFTDEMNLLTEHRNEYHYYSTVLSNAETSETTTNNIKLSLEKPNIIDAGPPVIGDPFKVKLDTSANPSILPETNKAFLKIFIKPKEKQSENKYIKIESATGATNNNGFLVTTSENLELSFTWDHIAGQFLNKIYTNSPTGETYQALSALPGAEKIYYDPSFSKEYFIRILAYKTANSSDAEKIGDLSSSFTVSARDVPASLSSNSDIFELSVSSAVPQNSPVPVNFTVRSDDSTVHKVVLYACNESSPSDDSSGCTLSNGEDAVKAAWVLRNSAMDTYMAALPDTTDTSPKNKEKYFSGAFKNLTYNENIDFSWNSSGLQPGQSKSLMLKAFRIDNDGNINNTSDPFIYIPGSKEVASITVNLGAVSTIANNVPPRSTSLSGVSFWDELASDDPQGSGLRSLTEAVARLGNLNLIFIGVLGFFSILAGGFLYMASTSGDEQQLAKAKKAVIYAVIAIFLAYLAFAIVRSSSTIITSFRLPNIESVMNLD